MAFIRGLRSKIDADRRARAPGGIQPVEYECNIPFVHFPSDYFDCLGDSEFVRSWLRCSRAWSGTFNMICCLFARRSLPIAMADPAVMNEPKITEEDVTVAGEFAPCTTTLCGKCAGEYFWMKMADSNWGWHSEWFYVANPLLPLLAFSGRFVEKLTHWEWGPDDEERRMWTSPMHGLLRELKGAGLTGVKVMWTFFERRIQPLRARAHPMFRYTGASDPTRMSPAALTPTEVRARMWAVIRRTEITPELEQLEAGQPLVPTARHAGYDPVAGTSGVALSSGVTLSQSGTALTLAGEDPHDVEATPSRDVQPQPDPVAGSRDAVVAQPVTPSAPVATLVMPPVSRPSAGSGAGADSWAEFLPRSSRILSRAAPLAVGGSGNAATTMTTESAAATGPGAVAGCDEVPGTGATPGSMAEPQAEDIPPGRAVAGGTDLVDLMEVASEEEEDMAALLEAAIDKEVVEEMNPERFEMLPDEAV
ncbi:hypothetical protein BAE44_0011453 [Dichanthelium oligosanthes]|uniref:Uncharacterized protein n=1 Tax=Dichanthelium oligosanthes TaxID=888268 RepID=A0A1E5VQY0_9POAL|nr:hypothetical protein BAE44_0011453 [Dichanthelium oligosanthes]